ncbi:MAG: hypothetical protein AB8V52_02360 [Coxiella endosymbiont of Dermacentor nuttalli]
MKLNPATLNLEVRSLVGGQERQQLYQQENSENPVTDLRNLV